MCVCWTWCWRIKLKEQQSLSVPRYTHTHKTAATSFCVAHWSAVSLFMSHLSDSFFYALWTKIHYFSHLPHIRLAGELTHCFMWFERLVKCHVDSLKSETNHWLGLKGLMSHYTSGCDSIPVGKGYTCHTDSMLPPTDQKSLFTDPHRTSCKVVVHKSAKVQPFDLYSHSLLLQLWFNNE